MQGTLRVRAPWEVVWVLGPELDASTALSLWRPLTFLLLTSLLSALSLLLSRCSDGYR